MLLLRVSQVTRLVLASTGVTNHVVRRCGAATASYGAAAARVEVRLRSFVLVVAKLRPCGCERPAVSGAVGGGQEPAGAAPSDLEQQIGTKWSAC